MMQSHTALQTHVRMLLFTAFPLYDMKHIVQPSLCETVNTVMVMRSTVMAAPPLPFLPNSATSLVDQTNLVEN